MRFLDAFEQKIIFPLMRLIALLVLIALLIGGALSLAGYAIWPAGAQEAATLKATGQETPATQLRGETTSPHEEKVSGFAMDIGARVSDIKAAGEAAKASALGFLGDLQQGLVLGTLARLDWLIGVIVVAAGFALAGFFTIVLAFLAIERNTRYRKRQSD